ncbi:trans-1,2-dihydrobenzene-1,2-diol dehydrogenase-like [Diadema setosum]|uniref:trans-1,2-dihydrobenzene-1,2-diol dehydrogenase-like n=1 Tax=Diadema setosum TaxID=31175 RepID=UPI003B3BAE37
MATTKPLRWGICTAGEISHDFAASLQGHEDTHLIGAVASRSMERSRKFAAEFNIPRAYGNYEELARDPDIDVVYIGSVNTEHRRLCKFFLSHKKHILCEKPLTLSLRETKDVLQAAKESDVFFMEAVWTRFFPVSFKIRELISTGQLGDVKYIMSNFGLCLPSRERTIKKALGGGALYDMGIYTFQFITMVFGRGPTSSHSHGFLNEDGVDETFTTVMMFPNNAMATISCSYKVEYPNNFVIVGTKGRLIIPDNFWAPTTLEWMDSEGKLIEKFEFPLPPSSAKYSLGPLWSGMLYEADAVKKAIEEGKKEQALISWKESELIASLMDKARRDLGIVWEGEELQG